MTESPTPNDVLLTSLDANPSGATTIGQFLSRLNRQVFEESGNFNGARPFGQMGWGDHLVRALILNNYIDGSLDELGFIDEYDEKQFKDLMTSVFDFLDKADYSTLQLPPEPKDYYIVQLTTDKGIEKQMVDFLDEPYLKEDAQTRVDELNEDCNYTAWVMVHIPT